MAAVPQPYGGADALLATQIPHILKIMTALTLGIPERRRVAAPSVGGAFGRSQRARRSALRRPHEARCAVR